MPWAAALVASAATFALGWALARPAPVPATITRTTIQLPKGTTLDTDNASIALSPDGTKLAYTATDRSGQLALWIRPLDSLTPQRLAGTEGATYPFWSPDGGYVGFLVERKLKKVPVAGGPVQSLCDVMDGRGASWGTSGVIVFSPAPNGGLWQVPASGGTAVQITAPEDPNVTHRNPHFLPDGKRVLFFSGLNAGDPTNGVYCLDLATKEISPVLAGDSEGLWVEPGWLAFVHGGNLMAQRIDARTLRTSGEAIPIVENVQFNMFRYTGTYTFSTNGLLLYEIGALQRENQLTWFDLEGKRLGKVGAPAVFWLNMAISPDGRRAAAAIRHRDGGSDLWMYDLTRGVGTRFTLGETNALMPVWSPDGREVAYADGAGALYTKPVDGSSMPRRLIVNKGGTLNCTAWHPDGSAIACMSQNAKTGSDVLLVTAKGEAELRQWLATPANEGSPAFSPDGRWITYLSDESGRQELYAASYPEARGKWLISTAGASTGWFSANGKTIRYWDLERKAYSVPVSASGAGLEVGSPEPLFGGEVLPIVSGAFSPDGTRLLGAVTDEGEAAPGLTLVTNWGAELR
jgi:Tol biopolymer transport system component